jgi:ferritin-like metal-binding protein YciE
MGRFGTLDLQGFVTLATWLMTLFIQRAGHREKFRDQEKCLGPLPITSFDVVSKPWNCRRLRALGVRLPRRFNMSLFSKDIKNMTDLHLHVLQDIYYAENQIKKALPDMIAKAKNRELTAAFKAHLTETEAQIGRLEQAFTLLGKEPKGTTCPAIDGIIKEANEIAGECEEKALDAALVAAAQAVEHYEITRYGTLIAWSEELGHGAVAKLLTTNLNEEKAADKKLTSIAEAKVNLKAAG